MIVDFHTHIFSPRLHQNRDDYLHRDPVFSALYSNPKARLATAEELIQSMDEAGIDVSVVLNFGWNSHELCVETNDYIMEAVSRYPGRLVGFCALQPLAGKAALRELERCARAGIRGIGELRADSQGFDMSDAAVMKPIMEMAKEQHLLLLSHASEPVGHIYPGKGNITPGVLYQFILNFPHQPLVLAHWGGGLPFYALMPEVAQALNQVFFDTAATTLLYQKEVFRHAPALIGTEKILFGTDYPLLSQKKQVSYLRSLNLEKNVEAAILGENARRLLQIG